ncbi:AAA family ATPase [Streptomyces sp. NPDC048720]|uniref:AAA family ATPase n=1 Tax=Streptomyces sp. NPDC048720 TaxID=3365588 RepID=UPI0037177A9D
MAEEILMGSVGPDDDEPSSDTAFIPKQSLGIELSEGVKQELALNIALGKRQVTNARDIRLSENKAKYLIKDLLPSNGLMFLAGASGTGKSILAFQFANDLVQGRSTMTFQIGEEFQDKQIRVLIFSLEMNQDDLQIRLTHMHQSNTEEEDKIQAENYAIYCEPEPFELWNVAHVLEMTQIIKAVEPDLVIIDSASIAFAEDLTVAAQVKASISHIYKIRSRLNVAFMVVAHTRKPGQGVISNPEETTLNELMGVAGLGQAATGILIMVEDENSRKATIKAGDAEKAEKVVWLVNAKARFGANAGAFKTTLTPKSAVDKGEPLMFRRNAIPIEMTDDARKKANAVLKKDGGAIMGDVNWGAALDGDE